MFARWCACLIMCCSWVAVARGQDPEPGQPIAYARSIPVPLNAVLLFDKAHDAWTWTFGKEPGAKVLLSDRENGVLEGMARVNFRSEGMWLRQESMGVVQYHVTLTARAGECTVRVTQLSHTGNRTSPRGGVHLGQLTRSPDPPTRIRGASIPSRRRLYAEVKDVAESRVQALLGAFEARLRASAEP